MVHGTDLLLRRVVALKKPIDYFDKFLNVMRPVRHKLNLIGNNDKITIFGDIWGNQLTDRFWEAPNVGDIACHFEGNGGLFFFDENPKKLSEENLKLLKKTHHKFNSAFFYSTQKFDVTLPEKLASFNKERFSQVEADYKVIVESGGVKSGCADLFNEYKATVNTARYARLLEDPVLFEEIKRIEFDATNITLTEEEQEIVDKASRSPELEGLIAHEGFEMYSKYY